MEDKFIVIIGVKGDDDLLKSSEPVCDAELRYFMTKDGAKALMKEMLDEDSLTDGEVMRVFHVDEVTL
jgi:hypothetical protein